jgi:hypothetical protein
VKNFPIETLKIELKEANAFWRPFWLMPIEQRLGPDSPEWRKILRPSLLKIFGHRGIERQIDEIVNKYADDPGRLKKELLSKIEFHTDLATDFVRQEFCSDSHWKVLEARLRKCTEGFREKLNEILNNYEAAATPGRLTHKHLDGIGGSHVNR